jgi:hypothetical protein
MARIVAKTDTTGEATVPKRTGAAGFISPMASSRRECVFVARSIAPLDFSMALQHCNIRSIAVPRSRANQWNGYRRFELTNSGTPQEIGDPFGIDLALSINTEQARGNTLVRKAVARRDLTR